MDPNEEYEVLPTGMDADGALYAHENSYGFCAIDDTCPCHEDGDLIAAVNADYQDGLLSEDDASNIVQGRTF